MNIAEHYMASDVEWDPTGRYVVTSVSWWSHKVQGLAVAGLAASSLPWKECPGGRRLLTPPPWAVGGPVGGQCSQGHCVCSPWGLGPRGVGLLGRLPSPAGYGWMKVEVCGWFCGPIAAAGHGALVWARASAERHLQSLPLPGGQCLLAVDLPGAPLTEEQQGPLLSAVVAAPAPDTPQPGPDKGLPPSLPSTYGDNSGNK